jgi:hypothetical protein
MRAIALKTMGWALFAVCTAAPAAENPRVFRPPRLPDGHVDLQGMWKNSNLTPLERAREFTQLTLTAADAARLRAEYIDPPGPANIPDDPGRALDRTFEPIRGEFRSSLIIEPRDGQIPWQEMSKEKAVALRRAVLTAFDNPEQRPPLERCLGSAAAPPMQPTADNNLYQIAQTPATIVIMSEFIHDARMIRMNATHSPAVIRSWLGDSIGWWEHDTLVIETKNFSPGSALRLGVRHLFLVSPQAIVTERFTRAARDELNYVYTVNDATHYTRTWTAETHWLRSNDKMYEVACHEGNYSMRGMLEAARSHDVEEASTRAPAKPN